MRLRREVRRRRRGVPLGWGASLLLHSLVVITVFPHLFPEKPEAEADDYQLTIRYIARESLLPKPEEAPPEPAPPPPEPIPEPPPEIPPEPEPEPEPEVIETPEPEVETESPETEEVAAPEAPDAPTIAGLGPGASRSGRSAIGARYGERAKALRVYGGGAETEEVVRLGLEWLARHQDAAGCWDPHRYSRHCRPGISCPGSGFPEYRTGVTALALLAFLGAGIDHQTESRFQRNVDDALAWLIAQQDEDGCFGPQKGQYLYNHGIATMAIAEAALLTRDGRLLDAARRGITFIERAQQPGGGWDYTQAKTNRNDLSVTGWQVMAIHSATAAGLAIQPRTLDRLEKYLSKAVSRDGSAVYADRGTGQGRRGVSIAAVGLLSKLYVGWSPRSPETERAAVRLVREGPDPEGRADWDRTYQSSYYWYYATLALFHIGGDPWEAWNLYLKRTVLPLQRREGELEGSFDPDPNWIGAAGGRVMSTALGVLTFEVYYRYTPLYRKLGLPAPGGDPHGSSTPPSAASPRSGPRTP